MVRQCAVPGCKSRGGGIKFFSVPFTTRHRWEAWLVACPFLQRYSQTQLENVRICILHFDAPSMNDKFKLNPDAIPKLNLPTTSDIQMHSNSQLYLSVNPIQSGKDLEISVTRTLPFNSEVTSVQNIIEPSTSTIRDTVEDDKMSVVSPAMPASPVPQEMDVDEHSIFASHQLNPQQPSDLENRISSELLHLEPTVVVANDLQTPVLSPIKVTHSIQTSPVCINQSRRVVKSKSTEPKLKCRVRLNPLEMTPRKQKLRLTNRVIKSKLSQSFKQKVIWKARAQKYHSMIKRYPLLSSYGKILVDSQLRLSGTVPKGRRYTEEEKVFALSLYKLSPKAYNFLRQNLALPCKSNINTLLTKIPLRPGINDFIFQHLEDISRNYSLLDKQAVLLFDEMTVGKNLYFNFHTGVIEGLQDLGNGERTMDLADKALVFMLRGLAKSWKIPIAFYFVRDGIKTFALKQFIVALILAVIRAGFTVRATISDQGSSNVAAIKSLISDARGRMLRENCGRADDIFHYEVKDDQNEYHTIFHIYDVPHLLKCFRNNFQAKNILIGSKRAKWEYVERLYAVDGVGGVARATKLTDKHVHPQGYDKMKVKLAAQVFSRGVSSCLSVQMSTLKSTQGDHFYTSNLKVDIDNGYFTAEILLFLNDLFDSLNGFGHTRSSIQNALSLNSGHIDFWNKAVKKLESMRFDASTERESKPLCLKHFLHDIKSIRHLWNNLKEVGFKFLSLRRLNQDPLENFFGQIRGQGGFNTNPDPHAFVSAYKTLLINNMSTGKSLYANCANDKDKMLGSLLSLVNNKRYSPYIDDNINLNNSISEEVSIPEENVLQNQSVPYIAGAVCRSILPKLGCLTCDACAATLLAARSDSSHSLIEQREYNPAKHSLYYPSRRLSRLVWECMYLTNKRLSEICHVYIYTELMSTFRQNVDVSWITCADHKDLFLKAIWLFIIRMQGREWCKNFNNRIHGVDSRRKGAEMENLLATKVSKGSSYRSTRHRSQSTSRF